MAVERRIFNKTAKATKGKRMVIKRPFFYEQQVLENQILLLIKSTKFGKN
jgi:hypothetical protein